MHRPSHASTVWGVSLLLALVFVPFGILLLIGYPPLHATLVGWGLAPWFLHTFGLLQLSAGAALLVPRTATYAAGFLAVALLGAVVATVTNGIPLIGLVALALGAAALYVLWARLPDAAGTDSRPLHGGL